MHQDSGKGKEMAVLNDRAMGIMDFISRVGADLLTPPNASPVFRPTSPIQQAMGRPQVQMSQDGSQMATTMPGGAIAMASPAMPTPGAQMGAPRPRIPDMGGAGVRMTQTQLMEQAAKAKALIDRTGGEIEKDPSFRSTVQNFFGNRENMLRLAMAFNTLRMTPDQTLAASLSDELKDIRAESKATSGRNATAEWLRSRKRSDLADLVQQGALDSKKAVELAIDKQGQVVTSQQLRQMYPGIKIEDGLYNIKADGTMNKVGGGGVSVQVGGPEAIQPGLEAAGKQIFEQDITGASQAQSALGNIAKTDEVLTLLDEGVPVTGLTATIQDVVNNARAMLGDQEAIRKASDTGLLNALLGQEVFGAITGLGIGARGLDTPAEREFLREVMAGTITMNEETIRKIAELRRKYAVEVINKYNEKVDAGDYNLLNQTFGNRYQKIEIPEKPSFKVPPPPAQLPPGVTPEMWPEIYRNMSLQDRALFLQ